MNEMFAGQFATMPVKLRFRKMPLTLIRPLCLVSERIIRDYAEKAGYRKQLKQCPYEHESKRSKVRLIFEAMERKILKYVSLCGMLWSVMESLLKDELPQKIMFTSPLFQYFIVLLDFMNLK